ncbi:MAG: 4Fe-4S binding protein [Thermodesulfovibrio sp.]|jgi:pyruvate ferredoxin oxidoreductase delta subunit|uniref:4Fe-4S binding protein n=1 Tax=Thermodesulfovibrio obliviosus TaxID=3118332 RepID=A0AAU8H373_9BACT
MMGWKSIPPGMVILEPGSALKFKTGSWRAFKPRWIEENCIQCLLCWLYCPDNAVKVKDGKRMDFDYDYCKGCGICARECPGKKGNKAIVMEEEVK